MTATRYGGFVETSNVRRFRDGLKAIEQRAAPEACFMVVAGEWGLGKTRLGLHHATQNGFPFVRIKAASTPHWVLTDLVRELGEPPARTCEDLHAQAIGILAKNPVALVFDEVENAVRDRTVIDTIRDVTDAVEVPCVLIGREYVAARLKRFPPLWSRVSALVTMGRLTQADMRQVLRERGPVEVDDELLAELMAQTEGRIRLAVNAAKRLARIARGSKAKLGLADVKGVDLVKEATARDDAASRAAADEGGER